MRLAVRLTLPLFALTLVGWQPLPVAEDPLVRLPGTQPEDGVELPTAADCLPCHTAYDPDLAPGNRWRGSMMAQAARDPLFWAAFAVAAQDAIWAVGRPNATDLCLRCHLPEGWVEGRSDPTSGALMTDGDFDGVHCGVCHRMVDPFFEANWAGELEGTDWTGYWDESGLSSTPSQAAADTTRVLDAAALAGLTRFDGSPFLDGDDRPSRAG